MSTFYKNKELAYDCLDQELNNKLDQSIIESLRIVYPEKVFISPVEMR